jgi:hypothetical protein
MYGMYEAAPTAVSIGGCNWYVRENAYDGMSSSIKCYCLNETTARDIADALNFAMSHSPRMWSTRP